MVLPLTVPRRAMPLRTVLPLAMLPLAMLPQPALPPTMPGRAALPRAVLAAVPRRTVVVRMAPVLLGLPARAELVLITSARMAAA